MEIFFVFWAGGVVGMTLASFLALAEDQEQALAMVPSPEVLAVSMFIILLWPVTLPVLLVRALSKRGEP